MFVMHTKGGNTVLTCVKDNIIEEKEDHEAIGLHDFDYKLFEDEECGGIIEGLDGYNYLNHIIKLWTGYWVQHMAKRNLAVGENNSLDIYGGNKHLFYPFRRGEFWKFIGCIILEVTYGKRGL